MSGGRVCCSTKVTVSGVLGMKTEPWGNWKQAGARSEMEKELG